MSKRILVVVDEPKVSSAYERALRKRFRLELAGSGREALDRLREGGDYAVIASDMHLPEMNGVELLARFREESPDTVRILLIGNADQQMAVDAVSQGDIFRFLNKPCPPEKLVEAIDAGLQQHRLLRAEKELLETTLKGSLNALSEVLALLNPEGFGRTAAIRKRMCGIVGQLGMEPEWWFEPLATLCLIGWVALPERVREKVAQGIPLDEDEARAFRHHPEVGASLLARIPRMEPLAESIRYQEKGYDGSGFPEGGHVGKQIPLGARLLKVTHDYERALGAGLSPEEALARMRWNHKSYDPRILEALETLETGECAEEVMEVDIPGLADGMVLHEDVTTTDGRLLVRKGQRVSPTVRRLIYNFWENRNVRLPILVAMPAGG